MSFAVSKVAEYSTISRRLVLQGGQLHEGCGMEDFDGSTPSGRALFAEAVCIKLSKPKHKTKADAVSRWDSNEAQCVRKQTRQTRNNIRAFQVSTC